MLLGGDPRRIDGDQLAVASSPGRLRWGLVTLLSHLTNDGGDFGVAPINQALLTEQSIFVLAREPEPFFARPWAEIAKRTDGLLARHFRGLRRLHQDVLGVRPAFVSPGRFADVHGPPRIISSHYESVRPTTNHMKPAAARG